MATNPDPKPGRWILPLVIVGMVGFTYLFVNTLEGPPATGSGTGDGTGATSTTSTAPEDGTAATTTTTPLDPALQDYVDGLATDRTRLAEISTEMEAVNEEWDAKEIEFVEAKNRLEDLSEQATAFADGVELPGPPAGNAELDAAHQALIAAARKISSTTDAVLAGLLAPDTGELRRAALDDFRTAVGEFVSALESAEAAAAAGTSNV